jgi:hypothetical protein
MIERSRLHLCLRREVLLGAAALSVSLFLILPLLALLVWLLGCLGFLLCWLAFLIMGVLSYGGLFGGCCAALVGANRWKKGEETGPRILGAGVAAVVIGAVGFWLFESWYAPVQKAADDSYASCAAGSWFLYHDLFLGRRVYFWSWLLAGGAGLAATGTLLALGLLRCETMVQYSLLKIGYTCPRCHRRGVPLFRCPGCRALVADLWPSVYGVWWASCGSCGEWLLTTDLAGRSARYEKVCRTPGCSLDLAGAELGQTAECHLAVVGAASAGKTSLLATALWQLEETFAPRHHLTVRFPDPREEAVHRQTVAGLRAGRVPPRTPGGPPQACRILLETESGRSTLVYLYDAAGDDFLAEQALAQHGFHHFVDGILFVVDPFAGPEARQLLSETEVSTIQPATAEAADILARLIPFWEGVWRVAGQGQFPVPLAVVVSKADATGILERLAGDSDLDREDDLATAAQEAERHSEAVRRFLSEQGLGNLAGNLEARFQTVRYFASAALFRRPEGSAGGTALLSRPDGRTALPSRPDGSGDPSHLPNTPVPFTPHGVVAPLIWLLDQSGVWEESSLRSVLGNVRGYLSRSVRGTEGVLAQVTAWGLLLGGPGSLLLGSWGWLGTGWTLGVAGLGLAGWIGWSRYHQFGWADWTRLRAWLIARRRQQIRCLQGQEGARARRRAWLEVAVVLVGIAVLGLWWWPAAVLLGLGVVAAGLGSIGGRL